MNLDAQTSKLVAGLVRVAVMAPIDSVPAADPTANETASDEPVLQPVQRQAMLLLSRRDQEYRLRELSDDLGCSIAATMAILSPLIGRGLVEMRPAPSYASRDMRVAATDRGLAQTPAPANWADSLLSSVERLDELTQQRLLRQVTTEIAEAQQAGRIPITSMCLSCRYFDGYRHPGTTNPHHCWYVDAPFGYRQLRLHCAEHVPAGNHRPAG